MIDAAAIPGTYDKHAIFPKGNCIENAFFTLADQESASSALSREASVRLKH